MKRLGPLAFLCGWLFFSSPVPAQAPEPNGERAGERPKIGLVLGGGSARGFAHAGVLEWLEEHRIPVDCVVGTSMGGLIGGAYASGKTPAEIREMIDGLDWDEVFSGGTPYSQKPYRRKEDAFQYPVNFEFGWRRKGLKFPAGLEPAQPIDLLLDRISLPYTDLKSFDELPIPFRCVATDMESGDQVVLRDGPFTRAMRATMSIPGVFTPVELDGRILADGGIVNNVPADIAKAMGAEVVIAVDVGADLDERSKFLSPLGMTAQAIQIMIVNETRRTVQLADTVIIPELTNVGTTDFRKSREIAQAGYAATETRARFLKTLALTEEEWAKYLEARRSRVRTYQGTPEFIAIEGADPKRTDDIFESLKKHLDTPLEIEKLSADLKELQGDGKYESLGFSVSRQPAGDILAIRVKEKNYGPPFINLLFTVNSARPGRIDVNLGSRVTFHDLLTTNSETRVDFGVGTDPFFGIEHYMRFGNSNFFVAPQVFSQQTLNDFFSNRDRIAQYRVRESGGGLDFGYRTGRNSELRLGYHVNHYDTSLIIGNRVIPDINGVVKTIRGKWTIDKLDSPLVPTNGFRWTTQFRWVLRSPTATGDYFTGETSAMIFRPAFKKGTAFLLLAGGTAFAASVPLPFQFTLGGPFRLGAYGPEEFRGKHYFYVSPGYLRQIGTLPAFVGGRIHAGVWGESGAAFTTLTSGNHVSNISAGLLLETRVGPILISGSLGEGGGSKLTFTFGRLFPESRQR